MQHQRQEWHRVPVVKKAWFQGRRQEKQLFQKGTLPRSQGTGDSSPEGQKPDQAKAKNITHRHSGQEQEKQETQERARHAGKDDRLLDGARVCRVSSCLWVGALWFRRTPGRWVGALPVLGSVPSLGTPRTARVSHGVLLRRSIFMCVGRVFGF